MSSENVDKPSSGLPELPVAAVHKARKPPKFSYARDFLLSLSQLDICKKLPSGFDQSVLSEFEDAFIFEQHRNPGGSYSQSSRRNERDYAASNRLESSSSYARGQGKWETRSSGSSDRDELQVDRDSFIPDPGRRYLSYSRQSWQQPEHDGLLGRPSGYSGQASSQRARWNGYHLSKSNEPYQPPRPYKAVPYSRKDSDLINDETFGSTECSSQDRAEEERRRRESFEMMRKKHLKEQQEKQKQVSDRHKEDLDTDIIASLKNSEDAQTPRTKNGNENVATMQSDSSRQASHMQLPASRPLVPPGFRSASVEKNIFALPSDSHFVHESGISGASDNPFLVKESLVGGIPDNILDKRSEIVRDMVSGERKDALHTNVDKKAASLPEQEFSDPSFRASDLLQLQPAERWKGGVLSDPTGKDLKQDLMLELGILPSSPELAIPDHLSYKPSGLLQAAEEWDAGVISGSTGKDVQEDLTVGLNFTASESHSTSILDKLFQNAVTKNDGISSNFSEHQPNKVDDETWSPSSLSSKFSHWFLEEKKKPAEDFSSHDILSLIVNNDKAERQESSVCEEKVFDSISSFFPPENDDTAPKFLASNGNSSVVRTSETHKPADKLDTHPAVLTCEDVEKLMLAEANERCSHAPVPEPGLWNASDAKNEQLTTDANDHASQHLFSLLHRGTNSKETTSTRDPISTGLLERSSIYNTNSIVEGSFVDNSDAGNPGTVHNIESSPTLGAIFGLDFMKKLQSAEAPLSAQRGPAGVGVNTASGTQALSSSQSFNTVDLFSSASSGSAYDASDIASFSAKHSKKVDFHNQEPWLGFESPKLEGTKHAYNANDEGPAEIQLPEEESLITGCDTANSTISDIFPKESVCRNDEILRVKTPDNIVDTLAALNSILRSERSPSLPVMDVSHHIGGPYNQVDSDPSYPQLHGGPSSAFPHQISHTRPLFQHLDSRAHGNPQFQFDTTDNIPLDHHHHHLSNMIPHHSLPSPGGLAFDPAAHPMLHNVPMPRNFSPHQLHGFPRGLPPPIINQMPPFMPEMNPMHGYTMAHRQPNHVGVGMGIPGLGIGSGVNSPEALERLREIELRANLKQSLPAASGHLQRVYGAEINPGFRYR